MLPMPDQEIEQLHHDGGEIQAYQHALELVPQPRAQSLIGEVIAVLEPESVVVEGKA